MDPNKRLYLISPPCIYDVAEFISAFSSLLFEYHDYIFAVQLRIKHVQNESLLSLGIRIGEICNQNNVMLIINDDVQLAHDLYIQGKACGLHIGQQDTALSHCRKILPDNMIIGVSCQDQLQLAKKSLEEGADYVSFGAFFSSKTKLDVIAQPKISILDQWQKHSAIPAVAIGGITAENCFQFFKKSNTIIAICNYIWSHEKGHVYAIRNIIRHYNQAILKKDITKKESKT